MRTVAWAIKPIVLSLPHRCLAAVVVESAAGLSSCATTGLVGTAVLVADPTLSLLVVVVSERAISCSSSVVFVVANVVDGVVLFVVAMLGDLDFLTTKGGVDILLNKPILPAKTLFRGDNDDVVNTSVSSSLTGTVDPSVFGSSVSCIDETKSIATGVARFGVVCRRGSFLA